MPPEQHAVLSASSAERWLHCPGSVKLSKDFDETTTEYAEEGSLAHALAEIKLLKEFVEPMGPVTYANKVKELKNNPLYSKEMENCTDEYKEHIVEICMSYPTKPFVAVEKKVDFSAFVPDGFGTADCIIIYGDELYVIDYKHGRGIDVPAENNPQMKLYALGAIMAYRLIYCIQTVHMHIVQPRNGGVKTATISADELINWGKFEVEPIAKKAYAGCDEYHSGAWCRWCKAGAVCRTRAAETTSIIEDFKDRDPNILSDEEIGAILTKADELQKYTEAVKAFVQRKLLTGETIQGWKLVCGTSRRQWVDQNAAFEALKAAGVEDAMLWKKEPCTLSALEKDIGKKRFDEIAGAYIIKPPGKPTVAPESDKRAAYQSQPTIQEDFKD